MDRRQLKMINTPFV